MLGLIQLALFVGLLHTGSFGGMLMGFFAPALIISGKSGANLFTRSP